MSKLNIKTNEEFGDASLLDLIHDDKENTLLAKFGTLGDANRCFAALSGVLFDNGELAQHETVALFPIMSNVAVFMYDKAGADAVEEYILEHFGV